MIFRAANEHMASSKTPQPQFDMHSFFPPYYPPSSSSTTTNTTATSSSFFPYPPPFPEPHANMQPPRLPPYHTPPPLNAGTQILALLNNNSSTNNANNNGVNNSTNTIIIANNSCQRTAKGRRVSGDCVAYDVDDRVEGETEPMQLEATPITKYGSDPELVLGRQIAVNAHYIVYGLKGGNVRVLNLNTASRALFRGHTKRVTDMVFFADHVHLLATVSVEGRVYVWKICEGPDEQDKPQITGNVVFATHFLGENKGDYVHPRLCWHCNKQDVLVVGIGKCVLRIDTAKAEKGEGFSTETPRQCSVDRLFDGIQLVGKHDGEVTDISFCQWTITRLVSASTDGTIKIWEDGKAGPLATLKPHGGQPVNSAKFLTAPHQAGHIILVTVGPLNKEVKIWSSTSEEGWLLPGDVESWKCTQTLDFRSSAEAQVEEAFFNQTVALSQAGLLLFANAKKNAIYSVHLDYGANPMATRMDYIAEFTVTMPILSFTGTTEPPGEHIVKLYLVQTLAIQQYALDLCQCLPPPIESVENTVSGVSHDASNADLNGIRVSAFPFPSPASRPIYSEVATARYPLCSTSFEAPALPETMTSNMVSNPISLARTTIDTNVVCMASPSLPLSPQLSRKLSGLGNAKNSLDLGPSLGEHGGSQSISDCSVDRQMDTIHVNVSGAASYNNDAKNEEKKIATKDISRVLNPSILFKHPTHLITPSEILMSSSSSETTNIIKRNEEEKANIQDVVINRDMVSGEVEVKEVGETRAAHGDEFGSHEETENTEKLFCSQASDLGIEMARDSSAILAESHFVEEELEVDGAGLTAQLSQPSVSGESEAQDSTKDVNGKVSWSAVTSVFAQSGTLSAKGKNQTGSNAQVPVHSSSVPNSVRSFCEPGGSSTLTSAPADSSQITTMQNTLNQLMAVQKELQKQMSSLVTLPVTKEGKRLEASLGRWIEKAVKASTDTLWARFQEENGKNEKLSRDRKQQVTLIASIINKDLTPVVEKAVKRELAAVGPAIVRTITPSIEKTISSTITESFQRGVGDKAVNMLERSVYTRLEATVGRQIQAQFQTSGKIALQDALKSSVEASISPAFEKSCKAIFEQVDATFQKGMAEHTTAALQHFETAHSPFALALRDSITSASAMTQTLSGELTDVQRKLISLAAAGGNPTVVNPLIPQLSNGPLHVLHDKVESSLNPAKELSRLVSEQKYEEAFTVALQRSDVSIVSWLCSQVDLHGILATMPLPLSQGVLLSLLQQLACDINKDRHRKLAWITDVAAAINPTDPLITMHAQPIFDQVYQRLHHQRSSPTTTGAELSSIRLIMHVINSMMMTCK